ncbi:hypothetical protein VTO73DRAFT_221 [Trametes versicolor]
MRLFALCFLVLAVACTATPVNHTIDDRYGDSITGVIPTYRPPGDWTHGDECISCNLYPANLGHTSSSGAPVDPAQAFNGTWHYTTWLPGSLRRNITVQFVGQAVYVFNIIANVVLSATTNTTLTFSLDGEIVGHYSHLPDPSGPDLMYNVAVYSNHSLPYGDHTLVISAEGKGPSLVLFDYVVYTADDLAIALPPEPVPMPVQTSLNPTAVPTSSQPTAVQTSSFTGIPLIQTPSILATSVLQWASPHSPFASATSPPPHHLNSAIIIGITAAGSALGTILLGLVAIFIRRRCKRRARARKTKALCSGPNAIPARLDTVSVPTVSSPLPAHTIQPPSPSDCFSRAATCPDSRRAPSLKGLKAPPTSPPPTDRHSARVRLLAKIVAMSRPRVSSPDGMRIRTAPAITARSSFAGEQIGRGYIDGLEHDVLRRAPTSTGGRLRAEVAGLREEIELLRETELAKYCISVRVLQLYQQGQGTVPGTVETQPTLVAVTP